MIMRVDRDGTKENMEMVENRMSRIIDGKPSNRIDEDPHESKTEL